MKFGEKNIGPADRALRIIAGIILIAVVVLNLVPAPWSYLVAILGIIGIGTGLGGSCTFYSLIGMNTLGKKAQN